MQPSEERYRVISQGRGQLLKALTSAVVSGVQELKRLVGDVAAAAPIAAPSSVVTAPATRPGSVARPIAPPAPGRRSAGRHTATAPQAGNADAAWSEDESA